MIAEHVGLHDADLDVLLAEARAAEVDGRIEDALAALAIAVAELVARNQLYQYPFEWLARLQGELGDLDAAERSLLAARAVAAQAMHRPGVFRMDMARARIACAALDHGRAKALLAGLRGDGDALGSPTTERMAEIAAWIDGMRFADQPGVRVAVLQAELVLTIAELWAEQGRYRSALRLVDRSARCIEDAGGVVRADQVELLRIEWLLAAGELAEADRRLAGRAPRAGADLVRDAVVRARAALLGGRLARAIAELEALDRAPVTDPRLFAGAAALRVAIQGELNLYTAADQTATAAIAKLRGDPGAGLLIALLDQGRRSALARRRSAIALWELPVLALRETDIDPGRLVFDPPAEAGARFTAAWTSAANRVLLALEVRDVARAAQHHRELERVVAGAESSYIAARVRLSGALIDYHRDPGEATLGDLLDIAGQLHAIGARQDEAQATRFAAWAAARLRRAEDYAVLARRAAAIIDDIAGELDPASRTLYLMNKWNGRHEFIAGRMKALLTDPSGRPRRPRRRDVLRAFREMDALTCWPIDAVFDDRQASRLAGDATADMVMEWLAERFSVAGERARGGRFALRSTLALWWFPRRTLVLHYHVLPDRTYLFRIARGHMDLVILPIGRVHLRFDMRDAVDDRARLGWLAEHLGIADALARFRGISRLVIVPHDAIANVPFAALPVAGGSLCEIVAISQLDRLSRFRRRRDRRSVERLVSVGLSSYAGSGQSDLPETETEARSVAEALAGGSARLYVGAAATCGNVHAALSGATHVHIAAHGCFDHAHPAQSGVLLRDGDGHRILTLHELRRLDLRRLRLATLATCRSAEGARLPGRERICLPTALLDAGARGVIASLWPVEDRPSAEIMTALYRRLRTEPPATALSRLQSDCHRATGSRRSWAGLVFYGNE